MLEHVVRTAEAGDLSALIDLYASVGFSDAAAADDRAKIWRTMLASDGLCVAVATVDAAIVATATLVTASNLLRGGRRHGFLENVATHPDWQGKGHGHAVVRYLLDTAWRFDCHHVLMQSGRADPHVHRFYENLGFVAGVRVGYVVNRPIDKA